MAGKRPSLGRAGNFEKHADAAGLVEKGRRFICLSCVPTKNLTADEVLGNAISGWWHKGHIGHKVEAV